MEATPRPGEVADEEAVAAAAAPGKSPGKAGKAAGEAAAVLAEEEAEAMASAEARPRRLVILGANPRTRRLGKSRLLRQRQHLRCRGPQTSC